jgi:hypothetical protein
MMRKLLLLCGAVLLSSVAAVAQSDVSTITSPSPAAAAPAAPQVSRTDLTDWQVSIGYQFTRFTMPSQKIGIRSQQGFTVNDNGLDVSFTRYLISWAGLEANAAAGFGSGSSKNVPDAKSIFVGGGPHFALRGHGRLEPWVHTLVGLEHFRFTQTAVAYGSNNSVAFVGGGGVDLHLNVRTAVRVQADYLGTDLFKMGQNNWDAGAAVVFNF